MEAGELKEYHEKLSPQKGLSKQTKSFSHKEITL